jgi:hypothetical protein
VRFKDHFSERAALYAAYRPLYPERLFEFVAGLTRQHCEAVESHAARGDTPVVIDPSLLRRNSSLRGNSSALRRYPSAVLALALVALLVIAPRSDAQHENKTSFCSSPTTSTIPATPPCSLPARVLRAAGRSHSSGGEAGLQEGKHAQEAMS